MSDDDNSRREFLQMMGLSSGALLLSPLACSSEAGAVDAGGDAGNGDTGGDAGSGDAGGMDGGVDGGDAGSPDAGAQCETTGSDAEGPFHIEDAPERAVLADEEEPGERLVIEGTVYESDCETPVQGAVLDIWHADTDGNYHDGPEDDYRLRGQVITDADGYYRFETIRPGHYPMSETMRPAHIHFTITKPGFDPLTTQMYFEGDPYLPPNDPCGGCNSGDPTLVVSLDEPGGEIDWEGTFDIVLTG